MGTITCATGLKLASRDKPAPPCPDGMKTAFGDPYAFVPAIAPVSYPKIIDRFEPRVVKEAKSPEKKAFFYWDNQPLSFLRYMTLKSFCHFNPDWEVNLYIDKKTLPEVPWETIEQPDFTMDIRDYSSFLSKLPVNVIKWETPDEVNALDDFNAVHRSDIFRLWVLAKFGGLYADMDIMFVRPMEVMLKEVGVCDVAIPSERWLTMGVLWSSRPETVVWQKMYERALSHGDKTDYQGYGANLIYRWVLPEVLTGKTSLDFSVMHKLWPNFRRQFPEEIVSVIAQSAYCPIIYTDQDLFWKKHTEVPEGFPSNTIGIHWYAGNPASQVWNKMYTHENWMNFDNAISAGIKKVLG